MDAQTSNIQHTKDMMLHLIRQKKENPLFVHFSYSAPRDPLSVSLSVSLPFLAPKILISSWCAYVYMCIPPLNNPLDLKEPPQPPNLEHALANDNANDKNIPPLDSAVGALGRVTMGALTDNNVALLILYPLEKLGKLANLDLEGILGRVGLGNVNNAVNVKGYLLGGGAPVLVTEAVEVLAVVFGLEGEVAVRDGFLVDFELTDRVCDLETGEGDRLVQVESGRHQKGPIPKSQCRGSRRYRTLCRQPGRSQSSCHRGAGFRGSIRGHARGAGCCGRVPSSTARWLRAAAWLPKAETLRSIIRGRIGGDGGIRKLPRRQDVDT